MCILFSLLRVVVTVPEVVLHVASSAEVVCVIKSVPR